MGSDWSTVHQGVADAEQGDEPLLEGSPPLPFLIALPRPFLTHLSICSPLTDISVNSCVDRASCMVFSHTRG